MKIGIRAHDVKKTNPEELAFLLNNYKINYIQLVLQKAIDKMDDNHLSESLLEKIAIPLNNNKINVALLGAYFNPIHSNQSLVDANIHKFKEHLKFASCLNTTYVATETGSYNDDKWTYNSKNHTEEAFIQVKNVVKELVAYAKTVNATVLIEGAYNHVIFNPDLLKRLIEEINSDHLKVIIDLYNFLNINNFLSYKEIFTSCLKLLNENIVVFHLKDFNVQEGKLIQTGLGQGIIDYDYIIKEISKNHKDSFLILEGITGDDIITSLNLLKQLEKKYE